MRSRAPLALVEQSVMILIFAVAAALCLRLFLWSDQTARESRELDRAVLAAQNAAETVKYTRGEWEPLFYNEDWERVGEADAVYALQTVSGDSGIPGLEEATVVVCRMDGGEPIFTLPVAWQEVSAHEE